MRKIYHIYAKDKCLYHSLDESDFNETWEQLNGMVGVMKTDYVAEDLTYEELHVLTEDNSPPGAPSY